MCAKQNDTRLYPGQIAGLPSPPETFDLIGQEAAEQAFLASLGSGKLPHAWLLAGPQGVGKATFAYRIARALLARDAPVRGGVDLPSLEVAPDHPVSHQIAGDGHPNLLVLKRSWDDKRKRLMSVLSVNEVRKIHKFYGLSAGRDTWRVTIIDTVDDMNAEAANALLKTLEEPPAGGLLLLVAHQLGRVLPTIRSRCRLLQLPPLEDAAVADIVRRHVSPVPTDDDLQVIVRLARGSAGTALSLALAGGAGVYRLLLDVLVTCPKVDPAALAALQAQVTGAANEERFYLMFDMLVGFVERLVRVGAAGDAAAVDEALSAAMPDPRERRAAQRLLHLPLERLADVWERLLRIRADSDTLHLDRKLAVAEAVASFERVAMPVEAWAV